MNQYRSSNFLSIVNYWIYYERKSRYKSHVLNIQIYNKNMETLLLVATNIWSDLAIKQQTDTKIPGNINLTFKRIQTSSTPPIQFFDA